MATPAATVSDYCALIVKSRLLPPEEVEALYKKWRDERPGGDERVDSFRRFLVGRRALTEYQAALIQRGRAEGFFLGGYKILDQIGKGQMGGVYKAVHNFGQLVAVKILPASRAKNAHVLGRFQREARLVTQLDHPNVVRAYQVGDSAGVHYIAMEFLEGETLSEVLQRRGRIPMVEAVRLVRQALDGLQHLHERRMVHRDLKPSNMMLTPGWDKVKPDTTWEATVKILDIGLGRELFDEDAPEGQIETQLTQEGSVLGTPDYLAPEQAKDARTADVRADIYSIGCVLYHCLTGKPPFPEPNIMAQMLKHATEPAPPLATRVDGIPLGFQAVMDRFLAKSPEERYQTPEEAASALTPFVSGGAPAVAAKMVPAFRDWLESESAMEMPRSLPPLGATVQATKASGTAVAAAPRSATVKPGTGLAPALKGGTGNHQVPAKPAQVRPVPVLAPGPGRPPIPAPVALVEEVDVELVVDPGLESGSELVPGRAASRAIWPPDRRDWIMLALGAAGVLSAVGLGYGLAKVLKKKDAEE